nr:Ku protein [Actinomycetota bacterium]
ERFIAALSATWDPGRHEDRYRERVLELVRAKEGSAEIVEAPEAAPPRVSDLMAALKASVEQAKSDRAARPARRRRETG